MRMVNHEIMSPKNNREQPSSNSREEPLCGFTVGNLIITLLIIASFSFFLLPATESPKVSLAIYI